MIGIEALPAIIYTVMMFAIPESPRWLITAKNNIDNSANIQPDKETENNQTNTENNNDSDSSSNNTDEFFVKT